MTVGFPHPTHSDNPPQAVPGQFREVTVPKWLRQSGRSLSAIIYIHIMSPRALPTFEITANSLLSQGICEFGITTFAQLVLRVSTIPYGRTTSNSPLAILVENRGTCSPKHRLLAEVAQEFQHFEVSLVVGIYDMSEDNTPGVGVVLGAARLDSIPEAHCCLKVDGSRFDFTGLPVGLKSPFESLVSETVVSPVRLVEDKKRLHMEILQAWADRHDLSIDDAWIVREACIAALAARQSRPANCSHS
jgi:hypothetical protein